MRDRQKLYCYVDETGQDTEGHLFLVSVVVTEQERESFARELERIEAEDYAQKLYQEARRRGIGREV